MQTHKRIKIKQVPQAQLLHGHAKELLAIKSHMHMRGRNTHLSACAWRFKMNWGKSPLCLAKPTLKAVAMNLQGALCHWSSAAPNLARTCEAHQPSQSGRSEHEPLARGPRPWPCGKDLQKAVFGSAHGSRETIHHEYRERRKISTLQTGMFIPSLCFGQFALRRELQGTPANFRT